MSPYPTTLPRVGCVWQHSIEIVGCAGFIKYVGLAAENRGVLVLRYSKGTKDTSTTASPTETLGKVELLIQTYIHQQKCCALPYENTVVPLKNVDGVSTARKAPKRNK